MKRIIYFAFFFVQCAALFHLQAEEPDSVALCETEIDDQGDILSRTIVSRSSVTLSSLGSGSSIIAEGIECSFFSLGTMYKTGLLRFCENPLGFLPTSTAFREKSGFKLNTSFSVPSRFIIAGHIIPDTLTLFLSQKDDGLEQAGCIAAWQALPWLKADLIFLSQEKPAPAYSDDWFFDRPLHPGGRVYHAASRVSLRTTLVDGFLVGGVSAGREMLPGAFFLALGCLKLSGFTLSFLAGHQSLEYITLSLLYPGAQTVVAGAVDLTLTAEARLNTDLTYRQGMVESSDGVRAQSLAEGKTSLSFLVVKITPLSFWMNAVLSYRIDERPEGKTTVCLDARLSSRHRWLLKHHGIFNQSGSEHEAELEYKFTQKRVSLSVMTTYTFQSGEFSWRGELGGDAGQCHVRIFAEYTEKETNRWRAGCVCAAPL